MSRTRGYIGIALYPVIQFRSKISEIKDRIMKIVSLLYQLFREYLFFFFLGGINHNYLSMIDALLSVTNSFSTKKGELFVSMIYAVDRFSFINTKKWGYSIFKHDKQRGTFYLFVVNDDAL